MVKRSFYYKVMLFKLFSFAQVTVKKTKQQNKRKQTKRKTTQKNPTQLILQQNKENFQAKKKPTSGTELVLLMPSQDIIVKYIS